MVLCLTTIIECAIHLRFSSYKTKFPKDTDNLKKVTWSRGHVSFFVFCALCTLARKVLVHNALWVRILIEKRKVGQQKRSILYLTAVKFSLRVKVFSYPLVLTV